ncbi:MAG TPA: YncE family protein [Hansschlegelia sp.]
MISARRLAAVAVLFALAGPARADGAAFAIVSQAGAAISFLTAKGEADGEPVAVGEVPASIAAGPDGRTLYVSHPDRGRISVVDAVTRRVTATFQIDGSPFGVAATDERVYATDWTNNRLVRIDALTGSSDGAVGIGKSPAGLAFDARRARAYSADRESDAVSVIDLTRMAVVGSVKVGRAPFALGLSPDGARLYVANVQSGDLSVIDTETRREVRRVKVGRMPYGVAATPDGGRILVTLQEEGAVVILDAATFEPLGRVKVGKFPEGVALSPDGATAAVANWFDDSVSLVDVAAMKERSKSDAPAGPRNAAAIAP